MEIEKIIIRCIDCPFNDNSMDGMECNHPYWKEKGAYENMIINAENKYKIPDKCPLKKTSVIIKL